MTILRLSLAAAITAAMGGAALAAPTTLTSDVMKETVTRDAAGHVVNALTPPVKITPGDHVVYVVTYKNGAAKPATGVVVTNPIPANLEYAGSDDTPAPLVSVDNKVFAPLSQLKARHSGAQAAATPADVTAVQWVIADAVPPGGEAKMTFRAKLK
jgi:uncharacterized repeat protein (TIGR01451 family)